MNRVFLQPGWADNQTVELPPEESRHLIQVLRAQVGDQLTVVDGKGKVGLAVVEKIEKHRCWIRVAEVTQAQGRSKIRVAFAIPKQAALDFIIHRCTEVGVHSFQPLLTQHSLKPDSFNLDRWQKVLREVCKQCEENFLPELASPVSLETFLSKKTGNTLVLCDEGNRSAQLKVTSGAVDVLIGAEGGWDKAEIAKIQAAGALAMGLGRNRLRAETAALAAVVLLKREIGET